MKLLHPIDLLVIALYFGAMLLIGWLFAGRARTAEGYFVGNRSYPGWVAGVSLFGAQISSITFVAYPADAFRTAWLRYLICLTLPVSVFIAARYLLPFFRRKNVTSLFEYLELRFGPKTRVYGATVFIISQCIRISMIQYLVALLMHDLEGGQALKAECEKALMLRDPWEQKLVMVIEGLPRRPAEVMNRTSEPVVKDRKLWQCLGKAPLGFGVGFALMLLISAGVAMQVPPISHPPESVS